MSASKPGHRDGKEAEVSKDEAKYDKRRILYIKMGNILRTLRNNLDSKFPEKVEFTTSLDLPNWIPGTFNRDNSNQLQKSCKEMHPVYEKCRVKYVNAIKIFNTDNEVDEFVRRHLDINQSVTLDVIKALKHARKFESLLKVDDNKLLFG
jgi:hypothetical protein